MVKEIERTGLPVVHMCTVVPISLTVGANRIVPTVAIPHPLGNPALSRDMPSNRSVILPKKRLPFPMIIALLIFCSRIISLANPTKGTPEGICPCVGAKPGIPNSSTAFSSSCLLKAPFFTPRAAIIL
jgi:branched-subunit amino acid transport protein AzlD